MSVVGDRPPECMAADTSSWSRWPPAEHEGAPVIGVNPVWPSTMQSRPRLANVIGVVVRPVPLALLLLDGTDSGKELGLSTAPAPLRTARLEQFSTGGRSTFNDTGAAAVAAAAGAVTPVAKGLDCADEAGAVVVVIWLTWFRDGPPPPLTIWRHRDAWDSSTNSSWWRWRCRFEISFSSCSFSSSRLSVSYIHGMYSIHIARTHTVRVTHARHLTIHRQLFKMCFSLTCITNIL